MPIKDLTTYFIDLSSISDNDKPAMAARMVCNQSLRYAKNKVRSAPADSNKEAHSYDPTALPPFATPPRGFPLKDYPYGPTVN